MEQHRDANGSALDTRMGTSQAEPEVDLREYWLVVSRHRIGVLAFAFALAALAALISFSMKPVFRATATLLIEAQDAKVVSIEEVYGFDSGNAEYLETQFEILKSRKLAEAVIKTLGIESHPDIDPLQQRSMLGVKEVLEEFGLYTRKPLSEAPRWKATVEAFQERVSVSPVPKTQLVRISFESTDAALAAKVANALGDAYIRDNLDARVAMTEQAAQWLTERVGVLQTALRASEQRLQEYREANSLIDVSGVKTLSARELDELTLRLVEARKAFSDAQNRFQQVQASGQDRLESLGAILESRVVQDAKSSLTTVELRVAELGKRYGSRHPKMIAARSERDAAASNFKIQVQQVSEGFREEFETARANLRAVEADLERAKGGVQTITRKEYELQELEREVQTNTRLYEMFFQRFRETDDGDFQAANARFTDHAVEPNEPVAPRKSLIVGVTLIVGLALGVVLAFLKESTDRTVKGPDDVLDRLQTSLLGVLPIMKDRLKRQERSSQAFVDVDQSRFAEAIRTIRTSVVLSGLDKAQQVIVVTSSVPGEGKTTLASNLAIALGQMERVLLVDADMRRPSLAKDFGFAPGTVGLSNLVAGTVEWSECLHSLEREHIDVITAGSIPPNPLELLSSKRFASTVDDFRKRYDRIIIDSAPAQAVSDALVLSTQADALIYVVKAESTPYPVAQSGIRRLLEVGAPLIGVVLNQVDAEKSIRYGGGGSYYGYYDAYGYSDVNSAAKPGEGRA